MSNPKISRLNFLGIFISIFALVFSYLSWDISKQSYNYNLEKDSLINIPEIRQSVDSTKIYFSLNNSAEMQNLKIVFPKTVTNEVVIIKSEPFELNKISIEKLAKKYIGRKLKIDDATEIEGTSSIPVMMNYSAIVYGEQYVLRENRLLMFHFHYHDTILDVRYVDSYEGNRCKYPLRQHYFFRIPFSESLDERIEKQDSIDVQENLEKQLKNVTH